MSSAIVDTGAPSREEALFVNYGYQFEASNSASAILRSSMDPNFGFSSPSMGPSKPAAGLSRPPRLAKLRKPLPGNRAGLVPPIWQMGVATGPQDPGSRIDPEFSRPKAVISGQKNEDYGSVSLGDNAGNNHVDIGKAAEKLRELNIRSGRAYSSGITKAGDAASGSSFENHLRAEDQNLQREDGSEVSELRDEFGMLHLNRENPRSEGVGEIHTQMKKLSVRNSEQHIPHSLGNVGVADAGSVNAAFPEGRSFTKDDFLNHSINVKVDEVFSRAEDNFLPKTIRRDDNPAKVDAVSESVNSFSDVEGVGARQKNPDKISGYGNTRNIPGSSNSGFPFLSGLESDSRIANLRFKSGSDPSSSSIFGSSGLHFNPLGAVPEMPSMSAVDKNPVFIFSSKLDNVTTENMEFKTPDSKAPLFFGLNRKLETKREAASGLKKKKGKSYKPVSAAMKAPKNFVFQESVQENSESSDQYSPMDFSPYEETLVNNNTLSRGSSLGSEQSYHLDDNSSSSEMHLNVPNQIFDEVLISATEALHLSEGEAYQQGHEEPACDVMENNRVGMSEEDSVSVVETESFKSATDELEYSSESFVTALETEASSHFRTDPQVGDVEAQGKHDVSLDNAVHSSFTFAASSFIDEPSDPARMQKKNYHNKLFGNRYSQKSVPKASSMFSQLPSFQVSGSMPLFSDVDQKADSSTFHNQNRIKIEHPKEMMPEKDSSTTSGIATLESCEKWRMKGNQAYAKGDFLKAEDFYSQGINSISKNETSRSCLRALMLCYSNRAATRMSLGRLREALEDCDNAYALDPNFLKVQVRAASCNLALGELENATLQFTKCLQVGPHISADRNLLIEASEGLEKAKKVAECVKLASELLGRGTSDSRDSAMKLISEGLLVSSHSEKLLQMKAKTLFMQKKYEELIQLCEQILGYAESNFLLADDGSLHMEINGPEQKKAPSFRVWCCFLIVKSYFHMGKLEEALLFVKNKDESDLNLKSENGNLEAMLPLIDIIRKLLHHKGAGNEAYNARKNAEAVEHYSAAISCSVESRPFAAICFCNRAAAYRAIGQTLDAISDCSIAIALDGSYYKAISRRAALYELIRDYGEAATDYRKLMSLLRKQGDQKINSGGASDVLDYKNELSQAQQKILKMEEAGSNEIPLNFYLILGVDQSADALEIKKAYRKAALKYHPDKAGQSFVRNENSDDATWKEIAEEVRKDANKLFRMIGEAYAVLSDTEKRSLYDLEEEMRSAANQRVNPYSTRDFSEFHNHKFERSSSSSSRRYWQDSWRPGASFRGSERSNYNWYS